MSKEELEKTLAALDRATRDTFASKKKALALLVKAGIATSDAKLAEPYRDDA